MLSYREDVIIFGASRLGEIAFNILKDKYNIEYFSDNDKNKWGKYYYDIAIISPQELGKHTNKKIIIASMYYSEISIQLKDIGFNNIYIFSYVDSNDTTYKKRHSVDKMCDLKIYEDLKLNEDFKNRYIENFSLIYRNECSVDKNSNRKQNRRNKNVLVIAYAFPPVGGSGVQRTLKFVKYLHMFGWKPIVITVGNDFSSFDKDYSLIDEIPNDVKIHRIDHETINSEQLDKETAQQILNLLYGVIDNQYIMREYLSKIQENKCSERHIIFEPDRYISWANNVLRNIENMININEITMVYTTSDPYSTNLVGYYVKKKYKVPWVADFRDEWTNNHYGVEYYKGDKFRLKLHRHMEEKIVNIADKVIAVTPFSSQNYRSIFRLPHDKVVTITNGYDEEDYINIPKKKTKSNKFTIIFYGTLHVGNSFLDNVIFGINHLIEENKVVKDLIEIRIIGRVHLENKNIFNQVDKYSIVNYEKYKPHFECLSEASNGDLLLLPLGQEDRFIPVYPGKIFEYMRLVIPILAISPKGSAIELLLNETQCGENFDYNDLNGIKNYILEHYNRWISGDTSFKVNNEKIEEFERRKLTGKLASIFNGLIKKTEQ